MICFKQERLTSQVTSACSCLHQRTICNDHIVAEFSEKGRPSITFYFVAHSFFLNDKFFSLHLVLILIFSSSFSPLRLCCSGWTTSIAAKAISVFYFQRTRMRSRCWPVQQLASERVDDCLQLLWPLCALGSHTSVSLGRSKTEESSRKVSKQREQQCQCPQLSQHSWSV